VEEMGFVCDLTHQFTFEYRAELGNGLIEHEVDHVFSGHYEGSVSPDPGEVAEYQYIEVDELARQIQAHPERFTPWLKTVWDDYRSCF
jgi:isopentenyldiphosphate isomerase